MAAPAAKNSPDVPPELAIGSKPLLVKFSGGEEESLTIMDPFDTGLREASLELDMLRGKRCLACLEGEWLLVLDEATGECFLFSLVSLRRIPLPPLLKPVEALGRCALSSPTPPDCTIVFSTSYRNYLVYCRPGDEEWRELPVETDGTGSSWVTFCTLLPGSCDDMCWVVPSSFKNKNEESLAIVSSELDIKTNKLAFDEDVEQVAAPWSSLPVDMVEELVARLSFIDYLNVRKVCKRWSSVSKPAQYAKRYPAYPVLMSICSSSAGTFRLFDPIIDKEYTLMDRSLVPCNDYFQMLLFAKNGWVLVLRGEKYMYATNPFTGEMLDLPEIPCLGYQFDGISFSSTPKSPDCIVCAIEKSRYPNYSNCLYVMLWRAGDEHWTRLEIDEYTQFRNTYSNPVFYHDEFHCLGTRGNLGVFNPHNMTWRVLDKPGPLLDGDPLPGDQYCHLLEFREKLIAIFRPHNKGAMELYKLDMSQMVLTKVERLDNEVIFVDHWNAVMMSAPRDTCCNKIYISKLGGYNEGGELKSCAFYDLKSRKYYPSYFNLIERTNSIWIQPNFKCQ
ncbi:hypothetical protein C2845_PM12G22580 [Panicum miliaceum]|uniref:F-box domain-containing protein n=1 Tax=Panicum miliaceum TaxID=4540 RepID=A0A3L6QEN1_PANMI|nr:hypothetical protein C2845_PM12G22580 [Panicum miliaceum]